MKPQEPIPHNYRMETLNKIFAFSALALLVVTAVTVLYDYSRGWKKFQLEFQRIQAERVRGELTVCLWLRLSRALKPRVLGQCGGQIAQSSVYCYLQRADHLWVLRQG